ncbi:MAG: hypothetical protein AAF211_04125 [Myxococcota bacterium]
MILLSLLIACRPPRVTTEPDPEALPPGDPGIQIGEEGDPAPCDRWPLDLSDLDTPRGTLTFAPSRLLDWSGPHRGTLEVGDGIELTGEVEPTSPIRWVTERPVEGGDPDTCNPDLYEVDVLVDWTMDALPLRTTGTLVASIDDEGWWRLEAPAAKSPVAPSTLDAADSMLLVLARADDTGWSGSFDIIPLLGGPSEDIGAFMAAPSPGGRR